MEVIKFIVDLVVVEMQGKLKLYQNGLIEKEKFLVLCLYFESYFKIEMQVIQFEKIVFKSEIQLIKSESLNLVFFKNGNVIICGFFMSSIDVVINFVVYNIFLDEFSDFDLNNSVKGIVGDFRVVQSYGYLFYYMYQINSK